MGRWGLRALFRQAEAVSGLLQREFLLFRKELSVFFLGLIAFLCLFVCSSTSWALSNALYWVVIYFPMIYLLNSFTTDWKYRWDLYLFTLPVVRFGWILSKFLLGLLMSLVAAGAICFTVFLRFGTVSAGFFHSLASCLETSVLFSCLLILVESRFGFHEARILFVVLFGLSIFFTGQLNDGSSFWFQIPFPVFLLLAVGLLYLAVLAVRNREVSLYSI